MLLFLIYYGGGLHSEGPFEPIFSLLHEDDVLASPRAAVSVCKMAVILEQEGALRVLGIKFTGPLDILESRTNCVA